MQEGRCVLIAETHRTYYRELCVERRDLRKVLVLQEVRAAAFWFTLEAESYKRKRRCLTACPTFSAHRHVSPNTSRDSKT